MDSATEDLYMQQLQELVRDEDKIVSIEVSLNIFKLIICFVLDYSSYSCIKI